MKNTLRGECYICFMSPISLTQRCKGKRSEGEDSFREGRRRGRERWMSRRDTGGRYRERQEAGQRQTDRKRSTAERREGEAERQCQYLSRSLQALWLRAALPVQSPSWEDWSVRSCNDGRLSWTLSHSGLSPVGTELTFGNWDYKALHGRREVRQNRGSLRNALCLEVN